MKINWVSITIITLLVLAGVYLAYQKFSVQGNVIVEEETSFWERVKNIFSSEKSAALRELKSDEKEACSPCEVLNQWGYCESYCGNNESCCSSQNDTFGICYDPSVEKCCDLCGTEDISIKGGITDCVVRVIDKFTSCLPTDPPCAECTQIEKREKCYPSGKRWVYHCDLSLNTNSCSPQKILVDEMECESRAPADTGTTTPSCGSSLQCGSCIALKECK